MRFVECLFGTLIKHGASDGKDQKFPRKTAKGLYNIEGEKWGRLMKAETQIVAE